MQNVQEPLKVFISYSHKDKQMKEKLMTHLNSLIRQKYISLWFDNMILPGKEIDKEVLSALENSQIVLLLLSSDYLSSDYCYQIEMEKALILRKEEKLEVVPILLRPVDLIGTPIDHLMTLPEDRKAVTLFKNEDKAYKNVAEGIRRVAEGWYRRSIPSLNGDGTGQPIGNKDKSGTRQPYNNYGIQINGNVHGKNQVKGRQFDESLNTLGMKLEEWNNRLKMEQLQKAVKRKAKWGGLAIVLAISIISIIVSHYTKPVVSEEPEEVSIEEEGEKQVLHLGGQGYDGANLRSAPEKGGNVITIISGDIELFYENEMAEGDTTIWLKVSTEGIEEAWISKKVIREEDLEKIGIQ